MRRIHLPFAACLLSVTLAAAGGFHLLHLVQYGRIAESVRWQIERCREDGRTDDAIRFASQYLEFRPDDVGVMAELAGWLEDKARAGNTRKPYYTVLNLYDKILRLNPEDDATRLKAVQMGIWLSEWTVAVTHLETLLARRGGDAELFERYGYCEQMMGRYDEAAGWYRKALEADPKRASTYTYYANLLYHHLKRPDEAARMIDEAVRVNPDSPEALTDRAKFLRAQNKLAEAAEAIRKARALAKKDDAAILLVAADIERAKGHYREAIDLLDRGCRKYPKNAAFVCALAWLQLYDGKPDVAIATLRAGKQASPKDFDILTLLGDLLARDGQVGALEQTLKELTELGAPADRTDYVQARLLMRRGRWAEAAALLDRLRAIAPDKPQLALHANLLLTQCHEQLNDAAGELDAYRRLLDHDPNAGAVRLDYARALARHGRADEARREFLAVVQRPEVSSRAVADTARTLLTQARREPKARAELERAIDALKLDAPNPNPVAARAALDLDRLRPADSLPAVEQALQRQPANVGLHLLRAALVEQQFGIDRALSALAEAESHTGDQWDLRAARTRLLASRLDPAYADDLTRLARGVERLMPDGRLRVLQELVAAFRALNDLANVTHHLELLAQTRPDYLPAREALYAIALRAGDESRRQAALAGVEAVEGKDGPVGRTLEAQRLLWLHTPGDAANLAKVTALLDAAAQTRPGDATVAFLRGRVAELAGQDAEALKLYQTAFDRGLAERPAEELFANLRGRSGTAPVAVLRDRLPLAERLPADRHPELLLAALPLYDDAAKAALAERLTAVCPPADAVQQVWLGRVYARLGLTQPAGEAFRRAVAAAPQSAEGWLALVTDRVARQDADGTRAVAAEMTRHLAPVEARLVVGHALEGAKRFDDARKEYDAARELKPEDTRPLKSLAQLYRKMNRPDDARQAVEALAALPNPTAPEDARWARQVLVAQLAQTPSWEACRKALDLLERNRIDGELSEDDQRARALVLATQKARVLPDVGRTARQEAIRTLEALVKQRSARSGDDLVLLARLYRAENDDAKAREVCARMRAEFADQFGCVAFLAREALREHDLDACGPLLESLRKLGSGQFETVAVEFQYRVLAGTHDLARRLLDDYVAAGADDRERAERSARSANLVYDFLEAYPLKSRPQAVADLRQTAVRLYGAVAGGNRQAFVRLVALLARQEDGTRRALELIGRTRGKFGPEVAAAGYVEVLRNGSPSVPQQETMRRFLEDAIEQAPRSTSLRLSLAEFYQLTANNERAVAVYRDVLAREPNNVVALNNLAWALSLDHADGAKVRESLSHIQRAIDLAGPLDELLDTKARILFESGRHEEGLRDMCEAVHDAPSEARLVQYATMLRRAGRPAEAERATAQALRFGRGAKSAPR